MLSLVLFPQPGRRKGGGEADFNGQAVASVVRQEMLYMALRAPLRVGLTVA